MSKGLRLLAAAPRLVTFDVTGTLLTTSVEQHYVAVAEKHGIYGLDAPKLERKFKESFRRLEAEHPIYGRTTGIGWEDWWRRLVYEVFEDQRHPKINAKNLAAISDALIDCYKTSECWSTYPDATDLLVSLRRRKVTLGVISNFDERLDGVLDVAGIRSYFQFVLTSYGLGIEKPNPEIFQEALRLSSNHLGRTIEPESAVHIGDNVDNDYLGARGARWSAILVNRSGKSMDKNDKVHPDDVFRNLRGVQGLLETMLDNRSVQ